MAKRARSPHVLKPRLRVLRGGAIVLGPGKAELLAAIARDGEIRAAANRLGMSYMRAWTLLREMNRAFGRALVETSRGGRSHGRASLTPLGKRVLVLYREMERRARSGAAPAWRRLHRLLQSRRKPRHT
jgi:molybdate transport system regulatory protein